MARTLCVWFPDWPLRRPDAPPDKPCFVVGEASSSRQNVVVAANELARESGVVPGMDRREADGLCPGAAVLERDLSHEQATFEPIASAIESIVPRIELAEPGKAFVLLTGALAYFGGEERLVDEVVNEIKALAGPGGRFGIARGPFVAEWAARTGEGVCYIDDEAEFLTSLDIGALGAEELVDTFRWLGIGTLGDLARLPRAAIASRFGDQGLQAHRIASGEDRAPIARAIPPELAAEERFPEPLLLLEQVGFAARRLTHRLVRDLQSHGTASHRVEIEAVAADGTVRTRVWRSADPFTSETLTERVWWQLRAWSESGGVPGGLVRLRIVPADLSGSGRQLSLLENAAARIETERAVARAQSLLGMDAVLEARPQGGRNPSERVLWHRWGESPPPAQRPLDAPWPGRTPEPAPALVPPEPEPLEVEWDGGLPVRVRLRSRWESVIGWAGPWRSVGRWWLGEHSADRYQLVTSVGALLCEVRGKKAFLVGIYD